MKFPAPLPVIEIAEKYNARLLGNPENAATGINEIHKVEPGDITFSDVEKYFKKSLESPATIILLNKAVPVPSGKTVLVCENPFAVYNDLILQHRPLHPLKEKISPQAKVHPTAVIEPGVILAHNIEIGANCHIQAGAIIHEYSYLGENVNIQSGAVIGTDAFYYKKTDGAFQKWRSGGRVIIEDNVEIGACCTVNKGVSGDTVIGAGTKLDCQVHIGHGAVIGKNCLLAGQVGVGGKTVVGDNVIMYGQVGVAQNLRIGDGVIILAKSGVSKNLEAGKTYFGYPAGEVRTKYKELAAMRHLPEFFKKFYK